MGDTLPGRPVSALLHGRARTLLELALALPVCTWSAWPFYQRALASLRGLRLNMFTLIGLGVSVAFGYSLAAALAPQLFPPSFRDPHSGEVGVYFEAAAVIVTLVPLGQVLELRARTRTGAALRQLLGLAAKSARRTGEGGQEEDVPAGCSRLRRVCGGPLRRAQRRRRRAHALRYARECSGAANISRAGSGRRLLR